MNSQNKNISYWKPYLKINGVLAKDCFPQFHKHSKKLHQRMVNQLKTAFVCALPTFGNNPCSLSYRGLPTQPRLCKGGLKLPCPLLCAGGPACPPLLLTVLRRIENNFHQIPVLWTNCSFGLSVDNNSYSTTKGIWDIQERTEE